MGKCGREDRCDLCAHEVDLHKAFAILTDLRPDIVEVTRQAELFNACAAECTFRQRSRFVSVVHVKGDGCKREATLEGIFAVPLVPGRCCPLFHDWSQLDLGSRTPQTLLDRSGHTPERQPLAAHGTLEKSLPPDL